MNSADEEVMATVLANENTCRMMLDYLVGRGVEFRADINTVSHEDRIDLILGVLSELQRRERTEKL
jgi:hypothetical protein